MEKIVVIGDESFTLGFELVGIEAHPLSNMEKLLDKGSQIGIIIISREDYEKLSTKIQTNISRLMKPIVVILSKDDVKGSNLRNQIIKALGVDLMKDK